MMIYMGIRRVGTLERGLFEGDEELLWMERLDVFRWIIGVGLFFLVWRGQKAGQVLGIQWESLIAQSLFLISFLFI